MNPAYLLPWRYLPEVEWPRRTSPYKRIGQNGKYFPIAGVKLFLSRSS